MKIGKNISHMKKMCYESNENSCTRSGKNFPTNRMRCAGMVWPKSWRHTKCGENKVCCCSPAKYFFYGSDVNYCFALYFFGKATH